MITYDIAAIEQQLTKASDAYYNGTPIMSDEEFDAMWREHAIARDQDPDNPLWKKSILDRVGAAPSSGFAKAHHAIPMLSLDNVFIKEGGDASDVFDWMRKMDPIGGFTIEPKIDGLSLRATYKDGVLKRAVTRGDGATGDDVTENAVAAGLLRRSLHGGLYAPPAAFLELNLEVCMTFEDFESINASLPEEERYSNPRNAASGILRSKNPEDVKGLTAVFHGVALADNPLGINYDSEAENLTIQYGLKFAPRVLVWRDLTTAGKEEPIDLAWLQQLAKQPYPTDGVVIKINDYSIREQLGSTSRAPRWARAVKFEQPQVITTLENIIVQVGRSGALTPVAIVTPVDVDGSIVTRASLHNQDQINRLYLQVGDRVALRKAAGIIPEVVRSITEGDEVVRIHNETLITDPTERRRAVMERIRFERPDFSLYKHVDGKCPCCGSTNLQVREEGATVWYCMNESCTARIAAFLQHACSRKALDITGIGYEAAWAIARRCNELRFSEGQRIDDFAAANGKDLHPVLTLVGLLNVGHQFLAGLRLESETGSVVTFGDARAAKAYAALQAAGKIPLHRWLFALGIPIVGESTSKEVARLAKDMGDLMKLSLPITDYPVILELSKDVKKDDPKMAPYCVNHNLGTAAAASICDYLRSWFAPAVVAAMGKLGVKSDNYDPTPSPKEATGPLAGKTFVITGTLSKSRDLIKADIVTAGGIVSDSVSKKTNFLVAGEKAGSKIDKAQKLGVTVLAEQELYSLMQ